MACLAGSYNECAVARGKKLDYALGKAELGKAYCLRLLMKEYK